MPLSAFFTRNGARDDPQGRPNECKGEKSRRAEVRDVGRGHVKRVGPVESGVEGDVKGGREQ